MSSFDPFEARLQFLQQLRKLNASQQSIHKLTSFAIKYASRCGEDLWECIMEQCGKGSLNMRINILYFLDSLVDESLSLGQTETLYQELVTRDLETLVDCVVPDTNAGVLNLKSAIQVLESWRLRRLIDSATVDGVLRFLESRKYEAAPPAKKRGHEQAFSASEIQRRMEEDRERHKRLRERIWILPIPALHKPQPQPGMTTTSPATPASPHPSRMPPPPVPESSLAGGDNGISGSVRDQDGFGAESALDVEFEQIWDGVEWGDEDLEHCRAGMKRANLSYVGNLLPSGGAAGMIAADDP